MGSGVDAQGIQYGSCCGSLGYNTRAIENLHSLQASKTQQMAAGAAESVQNASPENEREYAILLRVSNFQFLIGVAATLIQRTVYVQQLNWTSSLSSTGYSEFVWQEQSLPAACARPGPGCPDLFVRRYTLWASRKSSCSAEHMPTKLTS